MEYKSKIAPKHNELISALIELKEAVEDNGNELKGIHKTHKDKQKTTSVWREKCESAEESERKTKRNWRWLAFAQFTISLTMLYNMDSPIVIAMRNFMKGLLL